MRSRPHLSPFWWLLKVDLLSLISIASSSLTCPPSVHDLYGRKWQFRLTSKGDFENISLLSNSCSISALYPFKCVLESTVVQV
jgi:hypothetical protein